MEREEDEEEEAGLAHVGPFTQNPTVPEVGVAPSREPLQPSVEEDGAHEPKGRTSAAPPCSRQRWTNRP